MTIIDSSTRDVIAVFTTENRRQTKFITGDPAKPEVQPHQESSYYNVQEYPIEDLAKLHTLLTRLLPLPRSAIQRGVLINGPKATGIRRNNTTLRDEPHH